MIVDYSYLDDDDDDNDDDDRLLQDIVLTAAG